MADIWQAALYNIERRVNPQIFEQMFKPIRFHHRDGHRACLEVGDELAKAWLENYRGLIEEELSGVTGLNIELVLGVYGSFDALASQAQAMRAHQAAQAPPALHRHGRRRQTQQTQQTPHYPIPPNTGANPNEQYSLLHAEHAFAATHAAYGVDHEQPTHATHTTVVRQPEPQHTVSHHPVHPQMTVSHASLPPQQHQPLPQALPPHPQQPQQLLQPQQPLQHQQQPQQPAPNAGQTSARVARQGDFFAALDPDQGRARQHAAYGSLADRQHAAGLDHAYTFDTFVVGESNRFTHAACTQVSRQPGLNYNPLFIFGGVGLGKTHLMHAIGTDILTRHPDARVVYLTSEAFINRLVAAMRRRGMSAFREQFRDRCDVLLIDDIQFIGGKESTQEEFFHTFNALYHSGKQIVLTSDKPASELPGIEERLQSRFAWGLSVDVKPPELETRRAIIERRAQEDGIRITREVAYFLAEHIQSNVRELEGTLKHLGARARFSQSPITLAMAREYLQLVQVDSPPMMELGPERIITTTADYFGITPRDIKGPRRTRNISEPRQYAMYLVREHTDHSFPEIGTIFGGKNHTSVMSAHKKIKKLLNGEDPTALRVIDELSKLLRLPS